MHLSISEPLPLSADEAFHLIRDAMPELVPFLHDVDGIDVIERVDEGEQVRILNLWRGSMARVPAPARPFVTAELLSWHDHAVWTTSLRQARFRLEPLVGARIFTCEGTTTLVEGDSSSAQLRLEVDLEIHPDRVPGVPRLLARKLRGPIEQTIAG